MMIREILSILTKKSIAPKGKIVTLLLIVGFYLFIRLLILFFGFDQICKTVELGSGAGARELIRGSYSSFWNYIVINSSYGFDFQGTGLGEIFAQILIVPFFKLLGESYFAFKLTPLFFHLITLILLFLFLYKFFNKDVAVIASLLFILCPPVFIKLFLMWHWRHVESSLFTILAMYILFQVLYNKKNHLIYFVTLGLISALGLSCGYIFLITLVTCFLFWFAFDKLFFVRQQFFIFIFSFIVSFGLWAHYIVCRFNKFDLYFFPMFSRFFQHSFIASFIRVKVFLTTHLFNSISFEDFAFVKGDLLSVIYYLIIVFSFGCLLWTNKMSILKSLSGILYYQQLKALPEAEKAISKDLFILIYFIVFCLTFGFSNFIIGQRTRSFINYRYMAPLFPFVIIIIAQCLSQLKAKRNKYVILFGRLITSGLVLIGLIGNLNFLSLDSFGEGLKEEGFSYYFFGYKIASTFSNKLREASRVIEKIDMGNRDLFLQGFAWSIFEKSYNNPPAGNPPAGFDIINRYVDKVDRHAYCIGVGQFFAWDVVWRNTIVPEGHPWFINIHDWLNQFDREYRYYLTEGVGMGMGNLINWGVKSVESVNNEINKIDPEYRYYCYDGLGMILGMERMDFLINKINFIDKNYENGCYEGVGYAFGIRSNYNNIINYIRKIDRVTPDNRKYCYQGLGQGIAFRYGYDIRRCKEILDKVVIEYRPYSYYGLGQIVGAKYGYDIDKCTRIINQVDERHKLYFCRGLKDSVVNPILANEGLLQLSCDDIRER